MIFYGLTFAGLIMIVIVALIKKKVSAKKKKREAQDISCSESGYSTDKNE